MPDAVFLKISSAKLEKFYLKYHFYKVTISCPKILFYTFCFI